MTRKNKTKKISFFSNGKMDYSILIITLLLLSMGLIMLLSASAPTSFAENNNSYSYVLKQGGVALLGLFALFAFSSVDYRIFRKLKWLIYFLCLGLLILVGLFGVGENGARRWINIGFSFQPSEFAKVGLILFFAAYLADMKENKKIKKFFPGFFVPVFLFGLIAAVLFFLQNHLSAAIIIGMMIAIQMFVAGSAILSDVRWLMPIIFIVIFGIGCVINMALAPVEENTNFRFTRIRTWLKLEEADLTGSAWQITQSLYAIGSGGLFGLGLGNSKQKYLYLPEPQNDFIYAVLAEELGFIGAIFVIILFALFVWRGIITAMKAEDNFGTLIAIGITTMIGLQALINIAVVTNTIPVTGMPLPFFSYGGSAMLADLIAVGILLSISKNTKKVNNK